MHFGMSISCRKPKHRSIMVTSLIVILVGEQRTRERGRLGGGGGVGERGGEGKGFLQLGCMILTLYS